MTTALDPAEIKAEHGPGPAELCMGGCGSWPCLPYQLAVALAEERAKVQRVEHSSPGCACGVNAAGDAYIDPICTVKGWHDWWDCQYRGRAALMSS